MQLMVIGSCLLLRSAYTLWCTSQLNWHSQPVESVVAERAVAAVEVAVLPEAQQLMNCFCLHVEKVGGS